MQKTPTPNFVYAKSNGVFYEKYKETGCFDEYGDNYYHIYYKLQA